MALKKIVYLTDTEYATLKNTGSVNIGDHTYPNTSQGETLADIDFRVKDKSKEELDKKLDLFTEPTHSYTSVYAVEEGTNRQIQLDINHPGDPDSLYTRSYMLAHFAIPVQYITLSFSVNGYDVSFSITNDILTESDGETCASVCVNYNGSPCLCSIFLGGSGTFWGNLYDTDGQTIAIDGSYEYTTTYQYLSEV